MSQANPRKRISPIKIIIAAIMVAALVWAFNLQWQFSKARHGTNGLPFQIAKETTLYTEPVNEQGVIDYLKIMNERISKSEKRSDNAAIMFLEALGDGEIGREWQVESEWLAVDEKRYVSPPFMTYGRWAQERSLDASKVPVEFEAAMTGRWEPTEYPQIATWLDEMRPSLERVSEGAAAKQLFIPIVKGEESLYGESRSPIFLQELANAFAARAQLRLQVEDYRKAWEDVVTIYRIGKLLDQSPSMLSRLIGYYLIERAGVQANSVMANAPFEALNWSEIRELYTQLRQPTSHQELSANEHDYALHIVSTYAITKKSPFRPLDQDVPLDLEDPFENANGVVPIDWSIAMKRINQEYAELDKILADPNENERLKQLVAFSEKVDVMAKEANRDDAGSFSSAMDWLTPRQAIENRSLRFASRMLGASIPDFARGEVARRKTMIVMDCQFIASEVHFFKKKFGRYPDDLRELATENQIELPVDPISNLPFEYQVTSSMVSIYTLGEDGKASSDPSAPESDDWGVRFLVPNEP